MDSLVVIHVMDHSIKSLIQNQIHEESKVVSSSLRELIKKKAE